jgi:hypothetical protein
VSITADYDEKLLSARAPALAELAKASTNGNLERLRLGQLYYELTDRTNLTYESIDRWLLENHGVQMPAKSTVSRMRNVYDVWHLQAGVGLHDLAPFSPWLLYQVQLRTSITARTAPMWLQRMRAYDRLQIMEAAAGMAEKKPDGEEKKFLTFALQREIAEMFNDARIRFAESVGREALSPTAFIEFMSQLIIDSDPRSLKTLWARIHGEELE